MWYKWTKNSIDIDGQKLREFVYSCDFLDKKTGDIGGYAFDDNCLKNPFSSTDSLFFNGTNIGEGCTIISSKIKESHIDKVNRIFKSEINYSRISQEKSEDDEPKSIVIENSVISGNHISNMVIKADGANIKLKKARITLSKYIDTLEKPDIYVGNNCALKIIDSEVKIKNKKIKIKNSCLINCSLNILNSQIYDANINIVRDGAPNETKISNSKISGPNGSIEGNGIEIVNSKIYGKISVSTKSNGIRIRNSKVEWHASIIVEENTEKQIISDSEVLDKSLIEFKSGAKSNTIKNSSFNDACIVNFLNGRCQIMESHIKDVATIVDSNVFYCEVCEKSMIYNTTIESSTIGGDTKIGFSLSGIVPAELFSKTFFSGLILKHMFDFYTIPIIDGYFYYVFAANKMYRLSFFETKQFSEIFGLKNDLYKSKEELKRIEPNNILCSSIINYDEIILKSTCNIEKNVLDKRKNYNRLIVFSENLIYSVLIKALFVSSNKKNIENKKPELIEDVFSFEEKIGNNVVIDIAKKEGKRVKGEIIIFPTLLPKSISKSYLKSVFIEEYGDIYQNHYERAITF